MTASAAHWATWCNSPVRACTDCVPCHPASRVRTPGIFQLHRSDRIPGCTGCVLPRMEVRCRFPESGPLLREPQTTSPARPASSELRKSSSFRRCFDLRRVTRWKARCSSPPGAEFIHPLREESMWTKQQAQTESSIPPQAAKPSVVAFNSPSTPTLGSSPARSCARLGSSLQIKGQITGTEDLQIDGKVDGPISLRGHELTVDL